MKRFHPAILIFETFRPLALAMPTVTRSNYFASSIAHVKRFAFCYHVLLSFSWKLSGSDRDQLRGRSARALRLFGLRWLESSPTEPRGRPGSKPVDVERDLSQQLDRLERTMQSN